eukprot:COSAG03_NODE_1770_length_3547_cov_2.297274_2_plen_60_part_00
MKREERARVQVNGWRLARRGSCRSVHNCPVGVCMCDVRVAAISQSDCPGRLLLLLLLIG